MDNEPVVETPKPKKNKGGRPKGSGVLAELARLKAEIAALKDAQSAPSPELKVAIAELAEIRPSAALSLAAPRGAPPKLVPYKGLVRAREKCAVGTFHDIGEVFEVDVPALWSDDPYEAVVVTGNKEDGTPITAPNLDAPAPIDMRFRRLVDRDVIYPQARAV